MNGVGGLYDHKREISKREAKGFHYSDALVLALLNRFDESKRYNALEYLILLTILIDNAGSRSTPQSNSEQYTEIYFKGRADALRPLLKIFCPVCGRGCEYQPRISNASEIVLFPDESKPDTKGGIQDPTRICPVKKFY